MWLCLLIQIWKASKTILLLLLSLLSGLHLLHFLFPFHLAHLRVKFSFCKTQLSYVPFCPEFSITHSQSCAFSLVLCLSSFSLTSKVLYLFYYIKTLLVLSASWLNRCTSHHISLVDQLIKFQTTLMFRNEKWAEEWIPVPFSQSLVCKNEKNLLKILYY